MLKRLLLGFLGFCAALGLVLLFPAQQVQAASITTNIDGFVLDDPADYASTWDYEDACIEKIVDYLQLEDCPDWLKVLRIHDFVCYFVEYDYENLQLGNLEQNLYKTLTTGKTMCSGYSELTANLLWEVGIRCGGISCEILDHAWNVVELDGQWYNMDVTWDDRDDPYNPIEYDYFLRCDASFDHGRGQMDDREYIGYRNVTIAQEDYHCGNFGDNLYWLITDGTLTTYGNGTTITDGYLGGSWFERAIVLEGITTIGGPYYDSAQAFKNCVDMTDISLPVSLTYIGTDSFLGCHDLTDVYYAGSEEQWNAIEILSGNDDLLNARIHFAIPSGDWEPLFGTCGENLTWTLTADKVLHISGEGEMYDYAEGEAPWHEYVDDIFDIVIEDGVTGIGDYAFDDCYRVIDLTVPTSVVHIGNYAFSDCVGLRSFVIPDTVLDVDEGAFYGCNRLQNVSLSAALDRLSDYMFYGCEQLYRVTLPEGLVSIGDYCFYNASIYSLDPLPESLTSIGEYAFAYCSMSEIITSPNITEIAAGTFYGCASINHLEIPSYVTHIGDYAFSNCDWLYSVTFPGTPISVGNSAFSGCGMLDSITLNGVTTIGDGCFSACSILQKIEIPDGVTSIGANAFASCRDLETVIIAGSVKVIGNQAFQYCHGLTSVTMGEGVLSIGEKAFSYCTDLKTLTLSDSITSIGNNAFESCWDLEQINLPNQLTELGDGVFYSCALKSITVPGGVKNLGAGVFAGCDDLETVVLKDGVVSIGNNAFGQCGSLTSIEIPTSITEISRSAFNYCSKLKSILIPAGVTSIGNYAFQGCRFSDVYYYGTAAQWRQIAIGDQNSSLTNATIHYAEALAGNDGICNGMLTTFWQLKSDGELVIYGEGAVVTQGWGSYSDQITSITIMPGITSIGGQVFSSLPNLTTVKIANGVTSIDGFSMCTGLTSIVLPDSVTALGDYAFLGCTSLTDVRLSSNLTAIPDSAFASCSALQSVTLPKGLTSIGDDAFIYCSNLTDIDIPAGVTDIGAGAFWGCSSLAEVVIPSGVTAIKEDTFYSCSALSSIVLPNSVTSIGRDAFDSCAALKQVQYAGSTSQEGRISIASGNDSLRNATWYYGACTAAKEHTYDDCYDTVCNVCGNERAVTHAYEWIVDQFYCTSGGFKHEECAICHATRNENTVEPALLMHDYQVVVDRESDRCMPGVYHVECSICHDTYGANTVIPATEDHIFTDEDDAQCDVCGQEFFVITFIIDDNTVEKTRNPKNKPMNMPSNIPAREGYKLVAWALVKGAYSQIWAGGTYYTQESVTLYARWEKLCPTCEGSGSAMYICGRCEGAGKVGDKTCYRCDGTGEFSEECWDCWGSGVNERWTYSKPDAPVVESVNAHTVVLKPIENGEYSLDGIVWQDSPIFENLEEGKTYTFYQRHAETDQTLTSETSKPLRFVAHDHQYDNDECTICGRVRWLESIALTTAPDKTVYIEGETFSVTGGKLTLYFDDGSTNVIDLTDSMVSYFNRYVIGVQTMTVYYEGEVTSFDVEVRAKTLVSISVTSKPNKLTYLEGESFRKAGLVVTAYYDNGTSATITNYTLSGYDSTPGTKTITVTFGDKTATFTVQVAAKTVTSVVITTKPKKLTYLEGEAFDKTGMVVTVHYNNNTSSVVTDYTVSGYTSTAGTKTITVTYGGKTATFTVTVRSKVPSAVTSSVYTVSGGNISKIAVGTTVKTLLSGLNEGAYCKIFKGNTEVTGNAAVGTGMVVKIMDGSAVKASYTIIVAGDTNGDGKITVTDMLAVKAHVLKKSTLSGAAAQAADTSGDHAISITDFIQLKAHILGKSKVEAKTAAPAQQRSVVVTTQAVPQPAVRVQQTVVAMLPGKKSLIAV